jgi:DNA polymerase-3 subunit epsilon
MPDTPSLDLTRPLVVFDLETTGVDTANDRIIEIGLVRLMPDGSRETRAWLVNPGQPIPAGATEVHGITDADVADAQTFAQLASEVHTAFQGADLSGFNAERFDVPLLAAEFGRVGISFPDSDVKTVDSHTLFVRREPRNLAAAVTLYCDRSHDGAHRAEADAVAAADVLLGQLARYPDLPRDVAGLVDACRRKDPSWVDSGGKIAWMGEQAVLTFGKHRNRGLRQLVDDESNYLRWILDKDFPDDTKSVISEALAGRYPAK